MAEHPDQPSTRSIQFFLSACLGTMAVLAAIGCGIESISVKGFGERLIGVGLLCMVLAPFPAYWHEKGDRAKRDAALTVPLTLVLGLLALLLFLIAIRFRMPLQDERFAAVDRVLGVSSRQLVLWARNSKFGTVLNDAYALLAPLVLAAVFIPALTGRHEAKRLFCANLIAVALAVPCVALFPAIGPWRAGAFAETPLQGDSERTIEALRASTPFVFDSMVKQAGVVCFPSFHVIGATLASATLWCFRKWRPVIAITCSLIIISTVTTGWHYLSDVVAGLLVSLLSVSLAERCLRSMGSVRPCRGSPTCRE